MHSAKFAALAVTVVLLAGCAEPAQPTASSEVLPTADNCLHAYSDWKATETAKDAQAAADRCSGLVTEGFHDDLVAASRTIPSPGCVRAYKAWSADKSDRDAAERTLSRCDGEIDSDLMAKLRSPSPTTTTVAQRTAATAPATTQSAARDCHPAYATCIPNLEGDALNCADLDESQKPVRVKTLGSDPYLLDGNKNGLGCEDDTTSAQSSDNAPNDDAANNDTVSRCHPAYSTCIPNRPGDALNCSDLTAAQKPVRVKQTGVDPYRLDGDRDGMGCESASVDPKPKTEAPKATAPKRTARCTHNGRGHAYLGYNPGTHTHPTNHTHKTGKCAGV